jgi:hypothetical protein
MHRVCLHALLEIPSRRRGIAVNSDQTQRPRNDTERPTNGYEGTSLSPRLPPRRRIMADTIDCPSCGRRLKLPMDLLGQEVRCPACDKLFTAAVEEAPLPAPEPMRAVPMASPALPRHKIERPVRLAHCPHCGAMVEREARHCRKCNALLALDEEEPRHWQPHRGGAILTLGILGALFGVLSLCLGVPGIAGLAFGIPAWVMATHDIHKMRVGVMDRNGLANTQSGQSYAIVGVVLSFLCGTGWMLLFMANAFRW